MKWLYVVVFLFFSSVHPLFAVLKRLTEIENKGSEEITSVEGKIKRLEAELGIKTPPPETTFHFFGDFLYWKASLDGVAYATTAAEVVNADGTLGFDRFKARTVHFEYDPGFSIGAGVGLPYDQWDIAIHWLRFYTKGRDKAHGSLALAVDHRVIFDSIGMLESLLSPPSRAVADCQIDLNLVDLVLGRRFLWSHYFEFRPFAGLRGAWVDIDWNIAFTRPIIIPSSTDQSYAFLDIDNDFDAIGFLGGFESKWNFYKGLGLFSYATVALIYGKSSERTKEEFFFAPASATTIFKQTLKARNSTHAVKSVFDLAMGVKWEVSFKQHYGFLIRAGYEFFYWPNATQKTITQDARIRDRSDLSFQGIIIGADFEF